MIRGNLGESPRGLLGFPEKIIRGEPGVFPGVKVVVAGLVVRARTPGSTRDNLLLK